TTRRRFLKTSAATLATVTIVKPHVLGGPGRVPPSETLGGALIGVGGRGPGTYNDLKGKHKLNIIKLAECDVKWVGKADNQKRYTDFRRVLERKDIDVVAIATPPHWHALISIAAMEAGKDVVSEKPMTRFIAEGRAVADAEKRYGRVYQVGTYGRFSRQGDARARARRKLMKSGLLKDCKGVLIMHRGYKVKQWSGLVNTQPQKVPDWLDWDMYQGPNVMKPFHRHRFGGTHRGYWDYDGGGLGDMGQHFLDPVTWEYGLDHTSPSEITPYAPPAHPEAVGMWGWVELKYANGFTIVLESREWGKPYDRKQNRDISVNDLTPGDRKKLAEMPDPKRLLGFGDAVKARKPAGGNAEAAHRTVTIMHLANIAIRMGRKIHFDPVTEQIIGDDEANRLVNQPMRAPWHL
ncbi:MAG: Gfo/Idh/MocA family oxidoreductase, partial [Planctomycetota bacterium]|nr:Gfo/Idh/MocA family oxidoreductase [Planctomycetota bacterium]